MYAVYSNGEPGTRAGQTCREPEGEGFVLLDPQNGRAILARAQFFTHE